MNRAVLRAIHEARETRVVGELVGSTRRVTSSLKIQYVDAARDQFAEAANAT